MQQKTNMLSDALGFLIDETYMHARTRPQALGGLRIKRCHPKMTFLKYAHLNFLRIIWTWSLRSHKHCGPVTSLWDMTARQQWRASHMVRITRTLKLLIHSILIAAKPAFGTKQIEQRCVLFFFVFSHVSYPRSMRIFAVLYLANFSIWMQLFLSTF